MMTTNTSGLDSDPTVLGDDDAVDLRRQVPFVEGTPVEVRSRFDARWLRGFAVAVVGPDAYQLRRLSDGAVLPAWFPATEIRAHGTED